MLALPTALPKGPRTTFFTLLRYLRDPLMCMVPLVKEYGDPFTFPGKPPTVFTGNPEAIRAVYTADPDTFETFSQDFAVFLGRRSLLLLSGAEHRRSRKLMMPPFHGARMRAYGEAMCRLTEEHTADWVPGQKVSMVEVARRISLDVILQAVFGVKGRGEMTELAGMLLEMVEGFSPLIALFPWMRREFFGIGPYASFMRRQRRLHERMDSLIASSREKGPGEDILSLLVHSRYEDGEPMSEEEIRDQLLLLVLAGHETTAIALSWACYALHRPESAPVLTRLQEELDALGPHAEVERLSKQPYLEAVCQETLRRFPLAPAPSPRKLLRPMEVGGYTLPAGTGVGVAIGVVHFREDVYPEPLAFRPERFLERSFSPYEYVPFGGGARRCLGAALASYEMKLVLGTLLRRFRLRLTSLRPDMGKARAANVGPARGVKMVVEERRG